MDVAVGWWEVATVGENGGDGGSGSSPVRTPTQFLPWTNIGPSNGIWKANYLQPATSDIQLEAAELRVMGPWATFISATVDHLKPPHKLKLQFQMFQLS